eukprot:Nk52_evm11s967 gene=Nk52_evmTU11s967
MADKGKIEWLKQTFSKENIRKNRGLHGGLLLLTMGAAHLFNTWRAREHEREHLRLTEQHEKAKQTTPQLTREQWDELQRVIPKNPKHIRNGRWWDKMSWEYATGKMSLFLARYEEYLDKGEDYKRSF